MALVPALAILLSAQTVMPVSRYGYHEGSFSVIMPRPWQKVNRNGMELFLGCTEDHLYLTGAKPVSKLTLQQMKTNDLSWLQSQVTAYISPKINGVKILRQDAGGFHGDPCFRYVMQLPGGVTMAMLIFTKGSDMYALGCFNRPNDSDFSEAQRFFDSFRLETNVKSDPKLELPTGEPSFAPGSVDA